MPGQQTGIGQQCWSEGQSCRAGSLRAAPSSPALLQLGLAGALFAELHPGTGVGKASWILPPFLPTYLATGYPVGRTCALTSAEKSKRSLDDVSGW